jgi:hypothetical protein
VIPRASVREIRKEAVQLVTDRLRLASFTVEPAPRGSVADLVAKRRRTSHLVKVLAAAAPHRRGGTGSLGLHWMLPESAADLVALVDLSRQSSWLLPASDFKSKAQALAEGRFHLDWLVEGNSGRTRIPNEEDFHSYRLPNGTIKDREASLLGRRDLGEDGGG